VSTSDRQRLLELLGKAGDGSLSKDEAADIGPLKVMLVREMMLKELGDR